MRTLLHVLLLDHIVCSTVGRLSLLSYSKSYLIPLVELVRISENWLQNFRLTVMFILFILIYDFSRYIFTGIPTDDEDDDDIHFCKKCKQVFNKIEAYLEHKVKHENFKVTYNRSSGDRRMVLPMLVKKEQPETAHSMGDKAHNRQNNVHLEDESGTGQKKRRRMYLSAL